MPWETGSESGKYQYHPGGDPANAPKDAPSAVNVVVVPDVDLPKVGLAAASADWQLGSFRSSYCIEDAHC